MDIIEKINSRKWRKNGHWQSTIIVNELASIALKEEYVAPYGFKGNLSGALCVGDDYFVPQEDFDLLVDFYYTEITKDISFLERIAATTDEISEDVSKKIHSAELLEDFFHQLKRVEGLGVAIVPLDTAIEKYVTQNNFDPSILQMVHPIRKAYVIQERIDLLKLVVQKANGMNIETLVQRHVEMFGWMKNVNWRSERGHSVEYYKEEIDRISIENAQKELNTFSNSSVQERETLDFLTSHDKKHEMLLSSFCKLLDAKMLNWDVVGIAQTKWKELISRSIFAKLPYELVVNLTSVEIQDFIEKKTTVADIERVAAQRQGDYIMYCEGGVCTVYSVNQEMLSKLSFYSLDTSKKELSGQVAYPGKVQGKVKIIKGPEQAHEMSEGEILICPMTNPDLMPAILKAKAIVTDEGGVLCHAAIISRELKKPCVIGTKIATQILKTGDMVEVDAEKGIVILLK